MIAFQIILGFLISIGIIYCFGIFALLVIGKVQEDEEEKKE